MSVSRIIDESLKGGCQGDLHGIDGPDDEGEAADGSEKATDLSTLGHGRSTAVDDQCPDDDEVGDTSNGVPSPLLSGMLGAKGSEETSDDHDDIGNDGNQGVSAANASQQAQIEEEKRGSKGPVDITGPVDLTVDVVVGVRNTVIVRFLDNDVVVGNAVAAGHSEVGEGGKGYDEGGDDVIEAFTLRNKSMRC